MVEQVLEDMLVGGFGALELDLTGDPDASAGSVAGGRRQHPHSHATGTAVPRRRTTCRRRGVSCPGRRLRWPTKNSSYIRLNPRTYTPFGLGKLEVAFETIHEFLCAHRFASRLASNSVVQYALWLQNLRPQQHERLIRWWQDEIEGTGKVPILSVESKPEVLHFSGGTDADLRCNGRNS